jgi:polysaccharide export outer membrane protein
MQFASNIRKARLDSFWFFLFAVMCLLSGLSSAGQEAVANPVANEYRLGVGDKIQIEVYGEADLGVTTILSGSGVISYPFLGDLKITGFTPKEVGQLIATGLKGAYLVDPKVSVTILQYRPFYIYGEVKQSGGYPYQPGLTLRKAVSLAGGFTDRASTTKMSVIRETDAQRKPIPIALDDFVYPGDTVTIEQGFF